MTAWVYGFDEIERVEKEHGAGTDEVRGLFGGKGANLAEMVRLGIPVPPGFTLTTAACLDYLGGRGRFRKASGIRCSELSPGSRRPPVRASVTPSARCSSPAAPAPVSPCPG